MANIEKRTNKSGQVSYRVKVRLKGYPVQTATFKRLTDAKRWVQDTESAIREGRHFQIAQAKRHTLADLVDRYKKDVLAKKADDHCQSQQLDWWKEQIGTRTLADVTPALIAECRDRLLTEPNPRGQVRSNATAVRYLAALSAAFSKAIKEWQWLEISPVSKVAKPKEPRGRVRFLTDDERQRLLDACLQSSNKWLYLCVVLAIATGMRRDELMSLTWKQIDLAKGIILLEKTKNGSARRVHVAGQPLELLRTHASVQHNDSDLLFPGNVNQNKPIDLRKPFENALKTAGITDFVWHDLRHTAASYLLMGGASLAEVGEILGHQSLEMARRYAHLSESHIRNTVAAMNLKVFG